MSRTPSLYRAIKREREKKEKTGEDNRPNPFCAHVKIFLATATSKTNVYTHKTRTRQRRIFLIRLSRPRFTFHTEKKYEEKISSFFHGFVFISFRFFYLYVFFLSFFSFRQNSQNSSIVILSLSSCFILVETSAITYSD